MKRVVDRSARTTVAELLAAKADGVEGVIRTISHNAGFEDANVDPGEIKSIESTGVAFLGAYAMYRLAGWGAAAGAADGARDAANALAAGLGPRHFLALDLEGSATREEWKAHARSWLGATRYLVDHALIRRRAVYLAGNAAELLTGADLDELAAEHPDVEFWTAYDAETRARAGCAEPSKGWILVQGKTVVFDGAEYDDGQGDPRLFAPVDSAGSTPAASDTLPAPFDPTVRLPGESNGQYVARVARHFSGDSLHTRRAELAALLSRDGADDPERAVTLATNCATWACSVLFACLEPGPAGDAARAVLGASFFINGVSKGDSVGRLVFGLGAFVKWDGKTIPPDGAILAWNTPGLNDWHVGIVDESDDERTHVSPTPGAIVAHSNHPDIETTEAGGSDNSVNTGTHAPPYYSWGRPLAGWVPPDALPLRPYVPTAEETAAGAAAIDRILHPDGRLPSIVPPVAPSPLKGLGEA